MTHGEMDSASIHRRTNFGVCPTPALRKIGSALNYGRRDGRFGGHPLYGLKKVLGVGSGNSVVFFGSWYDIIWVSFRLWAPQNGAPLVPVKTHPEMGSLKKALTTFISVGTHVHQPLVAGFLRFIARSFGFVFPQRANSYIGGVQSRCPPFTRPKTWQHEPRTFREGHSQGKAHTKRMGNHPLWNCSLDPQSQPYQEEKRTVCKGPLFLVALPNRTDKSSSSNGRLHEIRRSDPSK